jgi:hypothetical protein
VVTSTRPTQNTLIALQVQTGPKKKNARVYLSGFFSFVFKINFDKKKNKNKKEKEAQAARVHSYRALTSTPGKQTADVGAEKSPKYKMEIAAAGTAAVSAAEKHFFLVVVEKHFIYFLFYF